MTVMGLFLINGEWSDSQMPTPVSPPGERYREGVFAIRLMRSNGQGSAPPKPIVIP